MRKTVYTTGIAIALMCAGLGLSACHQSGGEPENVPPADAGSVSADSVAANSAVADTAAPASGNAADTN